MSNQSIRAINYKCEEVGKYMKGSKKRFEWSIGLGNKNHVIILDFSFISGKVKVVVDGRILLENEIPINTSFQYPFNLDGFALNLIQQGQNCELRINNKVFSHLYTQEKTMMEFKKDDSQFGVPISSEFISKINSENKKITLDIGNSKKFVKKPKSDEADWGVFNSFGAPPGFQAPPTVQTDFGKQFTVNSSTVKSQQIDFFGDNTQQPVQVQQITSKPIQKPLNLLEELQPQVKNEPPPSKLDITSLYGNQTQSQQIPMYTTGIQQLYATNYNLPQTYGNNYQVQTPQFPNNPPIQKPIQNSSDLFGTSNVNTNQYFNTGINQGNLFNNVPNNNNYSTGLNYGQSVQFQPPITKPVTNQQQGLLNLNLGTNNVYQQGQQGMNSSNLQNNNLGNLLNNPITFNTNTMGQQPQQNIQFQTMQPNNNKNDFFDLI